MKRQPTLHLRHAAEQRFQSIEWVARARNLLRASFLRLLPGLLVLSGLILLSPGSASAQFSTDNLEFGGGYVHVSGDFGLNGYNLNTGLWLDRRVALAFDYDGGYNISRIGALDLTSFGSTSVNSHIQDFLFGPRFFFPARKIKKYHYEPFAEVQIGGTHLRQEVRQLSGPTTISGSASSFAWLFGGGADYHFTSQWSGRLKLDFFRTHLLSTGQSRWRLGLGVAYTLRPRESQY